MRKGINMIAGLPGTGIGGIFYLMSVFLMPVREMGRVVRGRSSFRRWGLILNQIGLASGIMVGFWAMGWFLSKLLPVHVKASIHNNGYNGNILQMKPFIISMVVLFGVLLAVELLNILTPKRSKKR